MKNNKFYLIIAVIGIVIILFALFKLTTSNEFTYQGRNSDYRFTIEKVSGIIIYRPHVFLGDKENIYAFRNKPQDIQNVKLLDEGNLSRILSRKTLSIVFVTRDLNLSSLTNDGVSIAIAPLDDILNVKRPTSIYKLQLDREFTEFGEGNTKNRVIDCDTANYNIQEHKYLVIYLKLGDENKVYVQGKCVIAQGKDSEGLIKSSEKLAYYLLGII